MGDLDLKDAAKIVRSELPDATDDEIKQITDVFGGFIHDLIGVSRDIQYRVSHDKRELSHHNKRRRAIVDDVIKTRFQQQVERVITAFAASRESNVSDTNEGDKNQESEDDMDPYLDPLKSIYSEVAASQATNNNDKDEHCVSWTQLQLWQTLKRFAESPDMAISFSELRDDVFGGDKTPVLELMAEDVLSFEVNRSSDGGWFWRVTPASPALGLAFSQLVTNSTLKETFQQIEDTEQRNKEKQSLEIEQLRLNRERKYLDLRKKSLLQTIQLGKEIGQEDVAHQRLASSFREIVDEEQKLNHLDSLLSSQQTDRLSSFATCNGSNKNTANRTEDHNTSDELGQLLKSVVRDMMTADSGTGDNQFLQLKNAFDLLDKTNDGKLSAEDVVRVVKESTDHNVSLQAAQRFVEKWDVNENEGLDYTEFVHLILSDERNRSISK